MNTDGFGQIFLGGKSLKELGFPKDWVYEPDMFRWRSENHKLKMESLKTHEKTEEYLYITQKMLLVARRKNEDA